MQNHYTTLEIAKNATKSAIKAAYRKLAVKYHPDKNTASDAAEKMQQINAAYEVLSDDNLRIVYDRELDQFLNPHKYHKPSYEDALRKKHYHDHQNVPGSANYKFESYDKFWERTNRSVNEIILGDLFSDLNHQHAIALEITPKEALNGCIKEIFYNYSTTCAYCAHKSPELFCNNCKSQKVVNYTVTSQKIALPAQITNGQIFVLPEKVLSNTATISDLHIQVFISNALQNVEKTVSISLKTAVHGGAVNLTGRTGNLAIKIPPLTYPGKKFRLKNEGIADQFNYKFSDLIITVDVDIPKNPTQFDQALIDKLSEKITAK